MTLTFGHYLDWIKSNRQAPCLRVTGRSVLKLMSERRDIQTERIERSIHGPLKWSVSIDAAACTELGLRKPNSITLAGSKLVQRWFELDSVMEFGFEPASNQLRTS